MLSEKQTLEWEIIENNVYFYFFYQLSQYVWIPSYNFEKYRT